MLLSPSSSPSLQPWHHPELSQTEGLGMDTGNHPCSLSITSGSRMDLEQLPTGRGMAPAQFCRVICRWISPELDLCPGCHLVLMCWECIPAPSHSGMSLFQLRDSQSCPLAGSRGGCLEPGPHSWNFGISFPHWCVSALPPWITVGINTSSCSWMGFGWRQLQSPSQ